jgi:pyruvate dehydrogenase E1 component
MNENYAQPSLPSVHQPPSPTEGEGKRSGYADAKEGILRGLYLLRPSARGTARVRLLGSGTILREALAAAELLEGDFGIGADVYSVTSFTELRREAMAIERGRRLGQQSGAAWVEQQLPANGTPIVAATDYVSALSDLIRPWLHDRYIVLGTDGFGRSDTRAALRRFFEVDRNAIVVAALTEVDPAAARDACRRYQLDADSLPPWTR